MTNLQQHRLQNDTEHLDYVPQIMNLYTTDLLLTEHLNYTMMHNTDVVTHVMDLDNYLPIFPCSWRNDEEQRKFIIDYR